MARCTFSDEIIDRLVQDIGRKLRAKRALIECSEGRIDIALHPKGEGFDVKIQVTG